MLSCHKTQYILTHFVAKFCHPDLQTFPDKFSGLEIASRLSNFNCTPIQLFRQIQPKLQLLLIVIVGIAMMIVSTH